MNAILKIADLSKAFSGVHAVQHASFDVEEGSITGLIGPNGSGKSTTIDCISGFQRPDAGRIELGGRNITNSNPATVARAGLIRTFQNVRVYETYNLLDNVNLTSGVPELASWMMMIMGLFSVGAVLRSRRKDQGAIALS